MLLTQDQEMIRDAVRDFAQEQIAPHAARWDKEHHFPKDVHQGLAALGAYGICVPEEFGGAQLDYLTLALVLEEIAAGDGGTSTAISVTNCPVNAILMRYGNAQQKRDWLTPLAQGQMLGAFCLTEPHVGSDASALRTMAVKDGDEYVINGVKQFITSGKNGHVAIVIAVTDKGAGKKGMSAFLVPTSNPGYVVARLEDKLGQHSSDTAQINFDNCRVPAENLIGEEGEGYKIALSALEGGRIGIAAQSVGMARSALEVALQYAKERVVLELADQEGLPLRTRPIQHIRTACGTVAEVAAHIDCDNIILLRGNDPFPAQFLAYATPVLIPASPRTWMVGHDRRAFQRIGLVSLPAGHCLVVGGTTEEWNRWMEQDPMITDHSTSSFIMHAVDGHNRSIAEMMGLFGASS